MDPEFVCISDNTAIPAKDLLFISREKDAFKLMTKALPIRAGFKYGAFHEEYFHSVKKDVNPNCYQQLMERFASLTKREVTEEHFHPFGRMKRF